jgi:hypothetical protein
MHIHGNPLNQGLDLYALSAAKTEAQKEAERVRKKLTEGASALAGETDDCVVKLTGQGEPQGDTSRQDEPEGEQKQGGQANAGGEDTFSDYA